MTISEYNAGFEPLKDLLLLADPDINQLLKYLGPDSRISTALDGDAIIGVLVWVPLSPDSA